MNATAENARHPVQRPAHVPPMLPVRSSADRCTSGFAYELSWDGVRVITHLTPRGVRIDSRRYRDVTGRYPEFAGLHEVVRRDAIIDGEIIVADDDGPSAARLQRRRQERVADGIMSEARRRDPVTLVVHDVLWLDQTPTWERPYEQRRALLDELVLDHPNVRIGPSFADFGPARARAEGEGCNGLIAKRLGSPYRFGQRSADWRLVGFVNRERFVVGGYVPGQGQRAGSIGALLVGRYPDAGADKLRYAGSVGTGFTEGDLSEFADLVERFESPSSPFADDVPRDDVRFCDPKMVVRVQYRDETDAGLLRYPVYKGREQDVDPHEVTDC